MDSYAACRAASALRIAQLPAHCVWADGGAQQGDGYPQMLRHLAPRHHRHGAQRGHGASVPVAWRCRCAALCLSGRGGDTSRNVCHRAVAQSGSDVAAGGSMPFHTAHHRRAAGLDLCPDTSVNGVPQIQREPPCVEAIPACRAVCCRGISVLPAHSHRTSVQPHGER